MVEQDLQRQPIGLWLKRADEAITRYTNSVLQSMGLTRFHWQVLNLLHERGPSSTGTLMAEMDVFVNQSELDALATDLADKGWLERDGGTLRLTDDGVKGREDVFARMNGVREASLSGVSPEDYAIVIRTLQKVVENLS